MIVHWWLTIRGAQGRKYQLFNIPVKESVAKGSEKKGTTKNTKSAKKSFSFPLWPSCSSWFKAFMLFATPCEVGPARDSRLREDDVVYINDLRCTPAGF